MKGVGKYIPRNGLLSFVDLLTQLQLTEMTTQPSASSQNAFPYSAHQKLIAMVDA